MLSIVIQAGGGSTRMGQDKALMPFLGEPLIQRVVNRLAPIADEMLVTTNRPQDYLFLGLPLFEDLIRDRGALGGLYTALAAATCQAAAVVACDMPFASAPLLEYAHDLLYQEKVDVVIPHSEEGLEPLHAVYRRKSCLPAIEASIASDQWKMIAWFSQVKVKTISADAAGSINLSNRAFWNLNTPEEFAEAEALASRENGTFT